ncbi:class I SAM-dependent methyltransferase [Methylocapsa aurea]|uniref:class I SAM-dependent methyltransferase n=1 Tax=Methylocapsa aurea TaxID=663610 RepID=UPI0006915AA7|nr:class I SAM-dependent methyltransferase [Methylocapsa aurea]
MTDWTAGYVTEVGCGAGYFRALAPQNLALAALAKGVAAPGLDGGPLRVLELGCGQGFSANVIAAANPHIEYAAIDFNPGHIASAKALARAGGVDNVHFSEASFEEFAADPGAGEFDFITLHGIYSWVSAESRAQIVQIAREKLRPGGILYLSYNCHPGWAPSIPIQRLFADIAAGAPQEPIDVRIDQFFKIFKLLGDMGARCLNANPGVIERFRQMETLPRNYLAHEFLNANWTIFHSADVSRELAQAKLQFVGSAQIADHLDPLNLTDRQQYILNQVKDPIRKESLRDLIVNQDFRSDIYIKGAFQPVENAWDLWRDLRFALTARAQDIPLTVKGTLAEAALAPETYGPLLDRLDAGPASVGQLLAEPRIAAMGWANLRQHLLVLVAQKTCQIALPAHGEREREKATDAFNRAVLLRARLGAHFEFLASPVTGAGVAVDRIGQLALLAMREGIEDRLSFVEGFLKDAPGSAGAPACAPERAAIEAQLESFDAKTLPVLRRLKIAETSRQTQYPRAGSTISSIGSRRA